MFKISDSKIRRLLVIAAATAYCLTLAWLLGLVPGSFLVVLTSCYVLASSLPIRARAICAVCCASMALLPWLGLGHGSFILMGPTEQSDRLLPTLTLPEAFQALLSVLYSIAETPFRIVFPNGNDLEEFIYFQGEGLVTVRPFVVFLFWLGLCLAFGMSIATSLWKRRRAVAYPRIDLQTRLPARNAGTA